MQWFTPIKIPVSPFPICHESKILSMGSCFAQTIGQNMIDSKFDCLVNPFGTIFNPLALSNLLQAADLTHPFHDSEVVERDGLFFHYASHSDLAASTKNDLMQKLLVQRNLCAAYLQNGTHLILTLGTAWVYELGETGQTVANCHKQPAEKFKKRLLSLDEMKENLSRLFKDFNRKYPDLKIILTVSPVRHVKDGLSGNQLSKSLLRVLCDELEKESINISYFPAYEILVDELRDYRFYAEDLIHPSAEAENYILEKWRASNFSEKTQQNIIQIQKIKLDLAHRPLNAKSQGHQNFLSNLLLKLERMNVDFDFTNEIINVKKQVEYLAQLK